MILILILNTSCTTVHIAIDHLSQHITLLDITGFNIMFTMFTCDRSKIERTW